MLPIAGGWPGLVSGWVDLMFERLEQKDPDHFAVRQYKKFLLSAGKTRSSILISCGARLAPFDIREVRELMEDDEMELDTIGDEKTVLFLIMSDTDTTFNFILAMLQSQLINLLCDRADDKYGGRLPVHLHIVYPGDDTRGTLCLNLYRYNESQRIDCGYVLAKNTSEHYHYIRYGATLFPYFQ